MTIKEVGTPQDIRDFLDLPIRIYKGYTNWIQPLDKDIEAVFDPKKNKAFQHGKCKRWLLFNTHNQVIGRVATFINHKYEKGKQVGGIGFFEVIEDQDAAFYLLDHCRSWLENEGMQAMDGPINFGERDRWWGLLIDGFHPPLYCMNYNPPYYVEYFEKYGFQVYFNQLCYGMKVSTNFQEKFFDRHKEISKNSNIHIKNITKNRLTQFARDFSIIYNAAWAQHGGGKSMSEDTAIKIFKAMKPVLDEQINWFAYEKEEPIACWINLPDLNHYFKHFRGKLGWIQKLYFLWLKWTKPNPKFNGIVFGVVPKWQGKGMDCYLIVESTSRFVPTTSYKEYEMQWIGDFNPKMIGVAENLGADITRKLATYRYLFDKNKTFKRHPII